MINTEAHKRIMVPNRADYTTFSTCKDGVWILKTNSGIVLHKFKDKSDCSQKANDIGSALFELYQHKQKEYERHRSGNPQCYTPTYEEANWVHKCLYKGFTEVSGEGEINPYHNWFGVSTYSPDRILGRGG